MTLEEELKIKAKELLDLLNRDAILLNDREIELVRSVETFLFKCRVRKP